MRLSKNTSHVGTGGYITYILDNGVGKKKIWVASRCTEWSLDVLAGMCEAGWKFKSKDYGLSADLHQQPDLPTQLLFWDCSTLKIKALLSFKMLGPVYPMTQHNIPEALNHQQHQCENLKSHCPFHPKACCMTSKQMIANTFDRFTNIYCQ